MIVMEFPTKNQDSQQINPIVSNRRPTDRVFIYVFLSILIAWTEICTPVKSSITTQDDNFNKIITLINAPMLRSPDGWIILPLIISTASVLLYALLTKILTNIFINFGQALYVFNAIILSIQVVIGTKEIVQDLSQDLDDLTFKILVILALIFLTWGWANTISTVASTFSFLKVEKNDLCDIVKDSCRTILCSPFIILFMGFITILAYFVFSMTFNALISNIFDDGNETLLLFYSVVIFLGGLCALGFLYFIATMVVSEYTINYYWRKDQKALSLFGRSVVNALWNHIGTIMLASTLFISSICGIVQACKHKRSGKNKENSVLYFVSKVYLALRISDFALIFSSVYGTGFIKSSQTTFNEVLHRPSLFLATLAVYDSIFTFIPLIILILGVNFTAITVSVGDPRTEEAITNISLLLHGLILPLIGFACLAYFTMKALLINKIIILNKENSDFLQYSDTQDKADVFAVYKDYKLQALSV